MLAIYCIRILVQVWLAAISKYEVHRYVAVILCLMILYVQRQHVLLCILNVIKLNLSNKHYLSPVYTNRTQASLLSNHVASRMQWLPIMLMYKLICLGTRIV